MALSRLIAKGDNVLFEMHDGRDVEPPARAAILHDPEGVVWPKCSLLIADFDETRGGGSYDASDDSDAKDYFGKRFKLRVGTVETPPQDICQWHRVGAVRRIFYERWGDKYPGDYKHIFGKRSLASLFRSGEAVLYSRGTGRNRVWRLELPEWCHLDDRGLVAP